MTGVIRTDCTTQENINLLSKYCKSSRDSYWVKIDKKLGKLSKFTESAQYTRCFVIQLYKIVKDLTMSQNVIRLDTDASRIRS